MNILVADDDTVSRTMAVSLLRKGGFEVTECADGQAALDLLLGPEPPPMAILDWMMPKLDGPDVIRAVRAAETSYPYLILLSNRSETADKVKGLEAGADDYLTKPVTAIELLARIHVGQRFLELQTELHEKSQALLKLERKQKASSLAQMAGGVAHHFNNKLQAVMGYLELMLMEHPHRNRPGSDEVMLLRRTLSAAEDAADIGRKLLSYLSQNAGKPRDIDLKTICLQAIDDLTPAFPALADTRLNVDDTPFPLHANPDEIQEVITQLLKNALEADPDHAPELTLTHSRTCGCLLSEPEFPTVFSTDELPRDLPCMRLTLTDRGPGIDPGFINQIFDPFTTTKFTGRGMGLPVCVGIIKRLGGAICVTCPPEGGTCVSVCIPAQD